MFVLPSYKLCLCCKKPDYSRSLQNMLGEAAHHLAESIKNWGNDPPLQKLYLTDTSIPMDIWNDILQSLKVCWQLTFLDIPDILDQNCGSISDNQLQEPKVRKIFLCKMFKFRTFEENI